MKNKITAAFLLFALFAATVPSVIAQTSASDWIAVQRIEKRTDLFIKRIKGKSFVGEMVSASDNEIQLLVKGKNISVGKNDVVSIHFAVPKSNRRAGRIGGITGAVAGLAVGGFVNRNAVYEDDYNSSAIVLLAVGGGVGGYLVGKMFGKGKKKGMLVYKAV